jgi:peroxiredoxin
VFGVSYAALWILVIFQTVVLLGLTRTLYVRQVAGEEDVERGFGLRGQPAPIFNLVALSGDTLTTDEFTGRSSALLFVSPDCETCSVTLLELEALLSKTDGHVVVICRSQADKCAQLAETFGLSVPVIADSELEISRLFLVTTTPTAVMIDSEGLVQEYGHPMGPDDVEALILRQQSAAKLEVTLSESHADRI